jgi:hypothetical protein
MAEDGIGHVWSQFVIEGVRSETVLHVCAVLPLLMEALNISID